MKLISEREFPNISKVLRLMVVTPTNSVGPERIASKTHYIENKFRSRLSNMKLSQLLNIALNKLDIFTGIDRKLLLEEFQTVKQRYRMK